jgi:hypothetical protein
LLDSLPNGQELDPDTDRKSVAVVLLGLRVMGFHVEQIAQAPQPFQSQFVADKLQGSACIDMIGKVRRE